MRLAELTRKAAGRLVRQVLGDEVTQALVDRVVGLADGNAFYLEELIRAVAQGSEALPETIVAMVESRLERLEASERLVLRAGSIFGETFWKGGVVSLLGGLRSQADVAACLAGLVEHEVIVRQPDSRFLDEEEYSTARAAPRGRLRDAHRGRSHGGAQARRRWLEVSGETARSSPTLRGAEPTRAGVFFLRAAEQAHRGGDSDAAILRAGRGLLCDVPLEIRVALLGLLSESHGWRNEWDRAGAAVDDVIRLVPIGSEAWFRAAPARLTVAAHRGRMDEFMKALQELLVAEPPAGAEATVALALTTGGYLLNSAGQFGFAEMLRQRMDSIVSPVAHREPVARAWNELAHTAGDAWGREDYASGLRYARDARASFLEAGHRRGALLSTVFVGLCLWCLGAHAEAEHELRETLVADEEFGPVSWLRTFVLIQVMADRGMLGAAQQESARMIEIGATRGLPPSEGLGHFALGGVLLRMGDAKAAEREVRASLPMLLGPLEKIAATSALAAALLAQGSVAEGLALSREAMAAYEALGAFGFGGAVARLVHVQALAASGAMAEAHAALAAARDRLQQNAAKIHDPALEKSFLEAVPENAMTLSLAAAWLPG
ncbi:MAG: hypothetical protein U0359_21250 [Byssovorax sp.]